MEDKEVMLNEEVEESTEEIEETNGSSGLGTGWAMLIGSGLTLAGIAAGKKLKKVWANRQFLRKPKKEETIEEDDEIEEEQQPESEEESDE